MGTKSNSARTRTRRGRKGRVCLSSHLCQGPGAARRAGDALTAYGSAASWRDGSDCCDRAARPWPQDSDLRGRALGAAVHVRSTLAARKAAASILVSCASPFEAQCQCVMKNSCALPRVYHQAAEVLLLQKSIAMAADAATGWCTPQALRRRRGLVWCPTACVPCQQSWDATVPHERLGRYAWADRFDAVFISAGCGRGRRRFASELLFGRMWRRARDRG